MKTHKGTLLYTHRYTRTHSHTSLTFNPLYVCVIYIYTHTCMYMCIHTYMCTYTTYMYAHMHSQPNLISEVHAIKRSFLKKTGYMQTSEKGHLNLSSGCHMHGLKHAWAHTHMYACLRLHRYTQESFRRNAF